MAILFLGNKNKTHERNRRHEGMGNEEPPVGDHQPPLSSNAMTRTPRGRTAEPKNLVTVVYGISIDSCVLIALLSVIHIVLSESESSNSTDMRFMVTLQMLPQVTVSHFFQVDGCYCH